MTVRAAERLQNFLSCIYVIPSEVEKSLDANTDHVALKPFPHSNLHVLGTSTSTREGVTKAQPNRSLFMVDALLITWMILKQALWLKLRFKTTTTQLARWSDGFIRWLPRSSVRIDRVEPRRKTSAKVFSLKYSRSCRSFRGTCRWSTGSRALRSTLVSTKSNRKECGRKCAML